MIERKLQKNLKIACPSCEQRLDTSGMPAFEQVTCPTCGVDIIIPYRFGQYLLEEPLRESAVVGVYRALDLKLDREVAIKVLEAELTANAETVDIFLRIGRRVAALNHPNIIPIFSSGEYENLPFLVMEFMTGFSVEDQMAESFAGFPLKVALNIAGETIRGLDAAKREGLRHFNLKPSNILLGDGDAVKVTDFGMSEILHPGNEPDQTIRLDLRYASPELVAGSAVDLRADLFSLGAILYQMLTGRPPWQNDPDRSLAMSSAAATQPPRTIRPEIPQKLSDFTMTLLAPDPDHRPQTYQAALQEVVEIRETVSSHLKTRPVNQRLKQTSEKAGRLVRGQSKILYRRQKARRVIDAAVLIFLLAITLILAVAARNRPAWYVRHVAPVVQWAQEKLHLRQTPPQD